MDYSFNRFNLIHLIADNVDVQTYNSIVWTVPMNDIPNQQYFIGAFAVGTDYKCFSDHFWIMGDFFFFFLGLPA
jgi:hypothetical protein